MFDFAVIGNGMMGSAASRYLSATGQTVLAIGPGEPADWQAHQGVFASHYDQGRITRIIDPDPVWAHLAARSIAVYPEIEAQSGITFHTRSGGLRVSPDVTAAGDTLNRAEETGKELNESTSTCMLSLSGLWSQTINSCVQMALSDFTPSNWAVR